MTFGQVAWWLYLVSFVFAVAGPAIAGWRVAGKYEAAKKMQGTREELNALVNPKRVAAAAAKDAKWGAIEFGLVGLGVAIATATSMALIPPA